MRVLFHPDFPKDVRRFAGGYQEVSPGLAARFRDEIEAAIATADLLIFGSGIPSRSDPLTWLTRFQPPPA